VEKTYRQNTFTRRPKSRKGLVVPFETELEDGPWQRRLGHGDRAQLGESRIDAVGFPRRREGECKDLDQMGSVRRGAIIGETCKEGLQPTKRLFARALGFPLVVACDVGEQMPWHPTPSHETEVLAKQTVVELGNEHASTNARVNKKPCDTGRIMRSM